VDDIPYDSELTTQLAILKVDLARSSERYEHSERLRAVQTAELVACTELCEELELSLSAEQNRVHELCAQLRAERSQGALFKQKAELLLCQVGQSVDQATQQRVEAEAQALATQRLVDVALAEQECLHADNQQLCEQIRYVLFLCVCVFSLLCFV
jgi:hypothetical protein